LYKATGYDAAAFDTVQLYDCFTITVLAQLEAYGFCGRGEGASFVADGHIAWPDGDLPVNTHGGSISEAYVHGFNHVLEGVRQIRGTSTCQVEDANVALVAAAAVVPTSAVLLRR
jgi:acetyl-CoA acetyltransferase